MGFEPGTQIGKYEIRKQLGQGGFGLVMVARDTGLDREVALKFMHAEHTANPDILRRFLQEARSAAKIAHPGIVTVFECGQVTGTGTAADGVAYIAMEMLQGETLSDRIGKRGRLDPTTSVEIARQVASALDAAHKAGIVHRDLKPDNIFLVTDPAMPMGERVKVLDFGIAKLAGAANTSGVQTQSMLIFGTPRYMSPEQCRSSANIDHRSDIYALGCILFELVCGIPPFTGETGELIAKHQLQAAPVARGLYADVPAWLDALITSMLAKSPDERPPTMAAVQQALDAGRGAATPGLVTPPASLGEAPTVAPMRFATPSSNLGKGTAPALRDPSTASAPHLVPARRTGRVLAGAFAAAALLGGGIWLATRRGSHDTPAPATQPPVVTAPPAPPSGATPAPTAPAEITLTVISSPPAEVWSVDHLLLGTTPYRYRRGAAQGQMVFFLRAAGYQDKRVELRADHDDTATVALDPVVAAAPKAGGNKPAHKTGVGDKGGVDGPVATPTPPPRTEPPATTTPGSEMGGRQ